MFFDQLVAIVARQNGCKNKDASKLRDTDDASDASRASVAGDTTTGRAETRCVGGHAHADDVLRRPRRTAGVVIPVHSIHTWGQRTRSRMMRCHGPE